MNDKGTSGTAEIDIKNKEQYIQNWCHSRGL